jgi:hypothetical protein
MIFSIVVNNKIIYEIDDFILNKFPNCILTEQSKLSIDNKIYLDKNIINEQDFLKYVVPLFSTKHFYVNFYKFIPKIDLKNDLEIQQAELIYDYLGFPSINNFDHNVRNFTLREIITVFDYDKDYSMNMYSEIIFMLITIFIKTLYDNPTFNKILVPINFIKKNGLVSTKQINQNLLENLIKNVFGNCEFHKLKYIIKEEDLDKFKNLSKTLYNNLDHFEDPDEHLYKSIQSSLSYDERYQHPYPIIMNHKDPFSKKIMDENFDLKINYELEYPMKLHSILNYYDTKFMTPFTNESVELVYIVDFVQIKLENIFEKENLIKIIN